MRTGTLCVEKIVMKIVKYTIVIIFFLAGIGSCQKKDKGCDANYSNLDSIKVISYTNFIHSKNLYTIVDSNCLSKISELLCEENKMESIKIPPRTILLVYYNNSTDTLIIHSNVVKRKGTTWVYKNNIESKINSYIATSKWNQKRVIDRHLTH